MMVRQGVCPSKTPSARESKVERPPQYHETCQTTCLNPVSHVSPNPHQAPISRHHSPLHQPINPHAHAIAYRLALQTPFRKPSLCASLFRLSSLSPMARTKPHRAYVWFSPVYR